MKIKIPWIVKCIVPFFYAYFIYLSSSKDTSSVTLPPYVDKLIHFMEFGLLCLTICWSLSSPKIRVREIYKILIAIGITSLYGISDEFHQLFTPHRSVDILDWLADTTGASTAGFLWYLFVSKRQMKKKLLAMNKTTARM